MLRQVTILIERDVSFCFTDMPTNTSRTKKERLLGICSTFYVRGGADYHSYASGAGRGGAERAKTASTG